ncbi:ACT domain-containing protein [Candidatus Bathyarchaeota archaeon]|nr:ACT domain-containing protein [Candidatus Bathyarchaeota archaeon]
MTVEPSPEMRPVFASTVLREHPHDYTLVSISRDEEADAWDKLSTLEPFTSVTVDRDEVSAVLRADDWNVLRGGFSGYREEGPYRLITFDIVLDLSLVGYLSVVSSLLAERGVSIYALSTYLRDHLLVKKGDAAVALEALQALIDDCRDY